MAGRVVDGVGRQPHLHAQAPAKSAVVRRHSALPPTDCRRRRWRSRLVPGDAGRTAATSRAIDPLTIEIDFPSAFAPGLRVLDRYPILPRHKTRGRGGPRSVRRAETRRASRPNRARGCRFVRNPHYWRKRLPGRPLPYLDEICTAACGGAVRRAVDFADSRRRPKTIEELKQARAEREGASVRSGSGPRRRRVVVFSIAGERRARRRTRPLETSRGSTSEAFRLAISMAVDRREYCKQVFFGACDPIAGPVTPANAAWFNPDLPRGPRQPGHLARACSPSSACAIARATACSTTPPGGPCGSRC